MDENVKEQSIIFVYGTFIVYEWVKFFRIKNLYKIF